MRFSLFLLTFVLSFSSDLVSATERDLKPRIAPGYQPVDPLTEKGLWMELDEYETAIQRSALLVRDQPVNDYVKGVACRVAGDYCADLRIYIIRNPGFNASMTANGMMQVWTGLLIRLSSEDELAAVLGHELAHYTQLHSLARLRQLKKSMTAGSMLDLGIILATGIPLPVGLLSAVASAMAYSRDQEEEADLLGVNFMEQAGFDPQAAARVWEMMVREEGSAAVKSRETGIFSQTHPNSAGRIVALKKHVSETYPQATARPADERSHVEILNRYYMMLMEDQLDTNRFGRTRNILQQHRTIGVEPGLILFFQGEMYRQRGFEGDMELAKESYLLATQASKPVADAYRNLGYMSLKQGDPSRASAEFRRYLELKPDADDRAMIEFYLLEP